MDYAIVLGDQPIHFILNDLPHAIASDFENCMNRLISSSKPPFELSSKSPYPIDRPGMLYRFVFSKNGLTHHFAVYYYWGENETDLRVYYITSFFE